MKFYAAVYTYEAGAEIQKSAIKNNFEMGVKYPLKQIEVHDWSTYFHFEGIKGSYNSVFFKVYDENDNEITNYIGDASIQCIVNDVYARKYKG